jgi:putative cardiolipin synthase
MHWRRWPSGRRDPWTAQGASNHVIALRASAFVAQLLTGELPLVWASTRMVSDPPAKVIADKATRRSLAKAIGQTTREL